MSLVENYLSYTKKWKQEYGEETLVLMQVGSFFEVYALLDENGQKQGSNIEDFSRINDMTISSQTSMRRRTSSSDGWLWTRTIRQIC